jgi:CRP/FNR family transcriptional regulator, cyclic AMP receptor protein
LPQESLSRLSKVRVLQTLPERTLRSLGQRCRWLRYRAGEQIVDRQSDDRDVFFVLEGRVRAVHYFSDREVILSEIGPGGHFGEFAAIDGCGRSASVVAIDDCVVAALTSDEFMSLLRRHFDMAVAIMRHLVKVIRTSDERITGLSTLGAMQRVGRELVRLAQPDTTAPATFSITLMPSHSSIASQTGTTRETVARTLARLAHDGLIERSGRRIRILDMGRLESLIKQLPSSGSE